jgi:hypothetical protein
MPEKTIKEWFQYTIEEKREEIKAHIEEARDEIFLKLEKLKHLDCLEGLEVPEELCKPLPPPPPSGPDPMEVLHSHVAQIAKAINQLSLIDSLLTGIAGFSGRAALFLIRDDKLVGWSGKGFSTVPDSIKDEEVKKVFFSLSANTTFKSVLTERKPYFGPPLAHADDHLIFSRFGGLNPEKILVLPFSVKGKPQAVIYCDARQKQKIGNQEISILSAVGEMSLDLLPIRQKIMTRIETQKFDEPVTTSIPAVIHPGETAQEIDIDEELARTPPPTAVSKPPQMPGFTGVDPERKARVIINDIILYNRKAVEDGRMNRNLFQVMGDTILQAKEEYLRKCTELDIFERNLIDILGDGDRDTLEGYPFEKH